MMDSTWPMLSLSVINLLQMVNQTILNIVYFTFYHYFLVELFKKMESEVYQLAKKWFAALSNAAKVRQIPHFTSCKTKIAFTCI